MIFIFHFVSTQFEIMAYILYLFHVCFIFGFTAGREMACHFTWFIGWTKILNAALRQQISIKTILSVIPVFYLYGPWGRMWWCNCQLHLGWVFQIAGLVAFSCYSRPSVLALTQTLISTQPSCKPLVVLDSFYSLQRKQRGHKGRQAGSPGSNS